MTSLEKICFFVAEMFKKIYLKLTLRLETFTHVVPLPFAIYFSVVTGSGSYLIQR
jgi:hypothetical protein